jgi:hypothetical protein
MHVDFADWYSPCTTGTEKNLTGELLTARWQGIETLTAEPEVLDLVRVVSQRPTVDGTYLERFRAAFKDADITFQMSGNDLELSVLAGSLLCELLDKQPKKADQGSLALLCTAGIRASSPYWIEPFLRNSECYLEGRLRTLRKQSNAIIPTFDVEEVESGVENFVAKLGQNNPGQNAAAADTLFTSLLTNFSAAMDVTRDAITELQRQSTLRKEETDVLTWLTAAVSRDASKSFTELGTAAASVIAGKELADLISAPGILAARAILLGLIPPIKGKGAKKSVTLVSAVDATDRAWRKKVVEQSGVQAVADLCPVLGALTTSLTTDEPGTWAGAYKKAYAIDPGAAIPPIGLSFQMHREWLLANT